MKIEMELDKHYKKDCLLLRDTFPNSDVGDLRHYSWKYLNYPLGTPTLVKFLTDTDDTVIARSSLLPQNITICGKTYKGALSVDSAIHMDYRNLKLFVQLMNYIITDSKTKKYSFIYAMPNKNSRDLFKKLFKFETLFTFKPIMYVPFNMSINLHYLSFILKCYSMRSLRSFFYNISIQRIENCNIDINNLHCYNSSIIYDNNFFKYRFCQCPTRKYLCFNGDHHIIVGRFRQIKNINIFFVVEIFYNPPDPMPHKIPRTLSALAFHLKAPVAYFLNSQDEEPFAKAGFTNVQKYLDRDFEVLFLPISDSSKRIREHDIKFSLGNIDVG